MANIYEDYSQLQSVLNPLTGTMTITDPGILSTITTTPNLTIQTGTTGIQSFNNVLSEASKKFKLVNSLPAGATTIEKKIYPFRESIVFKNNMKYYFRKVELQHDGSMKLMDDYEDLQVAGNPSGLQIEGLIPEQFIIATMDYLETIRADDDKEHTEAMKHLKFALAYLEKSNMEKVKQNALKNKL